MSSLPSIPARRAAPRLAVAPALAGFRPKVAAVAVAAAFALQPQLAQAQPRGAHVIHGGATVTHSGANAVIRTTNGAGTRHSAIDWQSFSVPAGSVTRFIQPSATSTSINRVVGDDPSAIFGTLRSNGSLVLVNPRGIAVGAGAVVDTNGFTASTLPMGDADAVAGRRVFQGAGGPLTVDGQVLARGGDVVLVGSRVQAGRGAVVQSQGATILAAGERVAVTGRGLEGIQMEVKAGNEAVNLGTLKGDAVGVFASTLRHSGHIAAVSSETTGGRVVLKAIGGDNHVDGTVAARAGNRGGRIDVLGERIALEDGALLRASGHTGGGRVRVGGDYQGASAGAPNAKRVYLDAGARIEADATGKGQGGRVIVWSDEVTRMHGHISARGGVKGGNGGFVEVSGKERLEFDGLVDLRAPQGRKGQLLLDPEDITIVHQPPTSTASPSTNTFTTEHPSDPAGALFEPSSAAPATISDRILNNQLALGDVLVKTSSSADNSGTGGQITVNADAVISWSSDSSLMLDADKGIDMLGTISTTGSGAIHLKARNGDIDVATGSTIMARQVKLEALAGNVLFDTLSVNPVDYGAAGAKLEIFASGDVIGDRIQANGGNGDASGVGLTAGGKGGTVHIKFGGTLDVNEVQADGGTGAPGDSMPGGNAGDGGDGGTVTLQHTGGNLVLDGVSVRVHGGDGGSTSSSTGAAGEGGNGGKLILKSPAKVVLQDASFSSFGGDGGASGSSSGVAGGMGSMDTTGRAVDVSGLRLDGVWNNAGKVKVGTESSVWGSGTFINSGELVVTSYASIDVSGGVKNRGLLKAAGTSSDVSLLENTGTVDVLLGAELYTNGYFTSNEGTLNVNGTLGVGTIACGECGFAPLVSTSAFTNQAGGVIAGSGTLVVGGGSGVLENNGKIAPGGVGSTGKLTVDGHLQMNAGSVLHVDLVNTRTYDILAVTGSAATGGTVEVGHPSGASIAAGDRFAVLQSGLLGADSLPGVSSPQMVASASGNDLVLRATAQVPAPAPAGTPPGGAQQQVLGEIITFQQLFEQAANGDDEQRIGKDDIVVTDVACTPR